MTPEVMQRVIKIGKEQKFNLRLQFWNQRKEVLEHIESDDVNITGMYDEQLQQMQDNE